MLAELRERKSERWIFRALSDAPIKTLRFVAQYELPLVAARVAVWGHKSKDDVKRIQERVYAFRQRQEKAA